MQASVIVPVYNVESYLEKCVASVLAQSCKDFELLLIDDGSTDGSGALCDRLAEKDGRIRVIHQENRGLGGARNTGIRAAKGDWLLFVDSDDWIEPWTLAVALESAEEHGADLVVFGFRSVDEKGNTLATFVEDLPRDRGFSLIERRDMLLIAPSAVNKLYRRTLFTETGIQYPPRVWYEDIRTTPKLMLAAERIAFSDFVGYNYLHREGSIMNSARLERNREILDAFDDLLGYFAEKGLLEDYRDELGYLALFHGFLTPSVRVIRAQGKHPLLDSFAAYLKEHFPEYRSNPYLARLNGGQKLALWLLERKQYWAVRLLFKIKG